MELYKLIATINNGTTTTFTMSWIPENFEGVKISQGFSFVNPIGYTPKFSVDTMRVILTDKTAIDAVFDTYGLESDVEVEIQKLNSSGTGYDYLSTFTIDFESYVKYDEFSEFALKSISTFDYYNNIKNTEQQIELTGSAILPNTQNYINYVSLKSIKIDSYSGTDSRFLLMHFEKNNEAKIYNYDSALSSELVYAAGVDTEMYKSKKSISTSIIKMSSSGKISFDLTTTSPSGVGIHLLLYVNNRSTLNNLLFEFYKDNHVYTGSHTINVENSALALAVKTLPADSQLFMVFSILKYDALPIIFSSTGNFFVDIKVPTDVSIIKVANETIKHSYISDILNSLFNNNISIPQGTVFETALTSSSHLDSLASFATIKPSEFLADFCLMAGAVLNFELDGSVYINFISDYFNTLLNVSNAIEITDFKDISINYNTSLNFASVSVGQEISDYDAYTYLSDWNKILTFKQENRNASENLDLSLSKYRGDFSGMLDYFYKRSQQKTATSKDNFIFRPDFNVIWNDDDFYLYDAFTPRAILNNWAKFLSFCFQNFSKNTLTISSNGGNVDNLEISGVNQMDDFVLNSTPRLLPIEYNLTGLIENIDFSEKILKINHEGENIYLFVIDAETTDQLNEQTIKGLKIQF